MKVCIVLIGFLFIGLNFTMADTFSIDNVHSTIAFKIKHLGVSNFYGMFTHISGTFSYNPDTTETLSVAVEVDANSIDTRNTKRDDHLRSPDFFNVKKYPKLTFKSAKVEKSGDQFKVTGNLTMLGVTKEVSIVAIMTGIGKSPKGETRAGFETSFTIRRSEFGMKYLIPAVSDEVTLIVSLEGIEQP